MLTARIARAKICNLDSFSFNIGKAKIATQMKSVLWINAALDEGISAKPLKNKMKGTEPPTNPIKTNCSQFFLDRTLNPDNLPPNIRTPIKNTATKLFFAAVKTDESC